MSVEADLDARRRIAQDLDTNVMVVAGAGTGKTTALVGRILTLIRSGAAPLREIAAITFTEAAAAELREQVRRALEAAADDGDDRMAAARGEIDDAAICTLHAFAQRILVEQCVDAGLPPAFEVLDDTAEAVDFELRWRRFADTLLADPGAEHALTLGFSVGLRHTDLATVAWDLHTHWDRLEDGGLDHLRAARGCGSHWPPTDPGPVRHALDRALETIVWCTDEDDNMARHLRGTVTDASRQLAAVDGDGLGALQLLATLPPFRCAQGRQENWDGHIAEVRAACAEAEGVRLDLLDDVRRAALGDLAARLAAFTLVAAEERRVEGRITFHDLLVHARRLVRRGGDCLTALQNRYRRLLIDEFQDTDPIQIELAAALVAVVDGPADVAGARPGGLFVVGDPKQSIYRFRRADIDLFERVGSDIGSTVVLQDNFRSVPGVVDFVNTVFSEIFGAGRIPGQAPHHPLRAARAAPAGCGGPGGAPGPDPAAVQLTFDGLETPDVPAPSPPRRRISAPSRPGLVPGAAVVALGGPLPVSTPEVRRRAATDSATAIDHLVSRRWLVEDPGDGTLRPTRFGDVAVLIPARSSLPALEEAFEEAGLPYRLEGAALLWGAEEVREVLTVLRAADDPSDAVAVLGALRSPGLACGDDDLVTWYSAGGSWDPRAPVPPGLEDHPVTEAMAVLDRLHGRRWWSEPSDMVMAAFDELRSFALALSHRRPRDHWQRLRWLLDQARLFDESSGGTLRAFLSWADLRAEGDGRAGGVGPPDPDDDAVRVMTIHGAKGLEFPVVVLAGLERDPSDGPRPPAVLWTEHGIPEVRVGPLRTAGFEQAGLRETRLDILEQHRLLYVGMTRARDHLVVCLHHKQRTGGAEPSLAALVTGICGEHRHLWRGLPDPGAPDASATAAGGGGYPGRGQDSAGPDSDRDPLEAHSPGWETDRRALLARQRRRPVATATTVAASGATDGNGDGAAADGIHLEPPPVGAGGPGSPEVDPGPADEPLRRGRAVHSALAAIDLRTGCDAAGTPADEVARAHALAQGVATGAPQVVAMVLSALSSPTVTSGARCRHWHEVPVAVPLGPDGVFEGFVDLLVEEVGGLVVVDFKTDRIGPPSGSNAGMVPHRLQVAAYAAALEAATGLPVVRCVLVFVGAGAPWEHVVEGTELELLRRQALAVAGALVGD